MLPENISHAALDPIPDHSFADSFRNGEPQARTNPVRFLPRQTKSGEQGTGEASAMVIYGSEFGGTQDPASARKALVAAGGGIRLRSRNGRLFRR